MLYFEIMDYNFLAFITNIRGSQLFIILLVVLILFGTKRLPDIARGIGKAIREFRNSASDLEREFKSSINKTEVENKTPETPGCLELQILPQEPYPQNHHPPNLASEVAAVE